MSFTTSAVIGFGIPAVKFMSILGIDDWCDHYEQFGLEAFIPYDDCSDGEVVLYFPLAECVDLGYDDLDIDDFKFSIDTYKSSLSKNMVDHFRLFLGASRL